MITYNIPKNTINKHAFLRSSDGNAIYFMCPVKNKVIMYHDDEKDLARKQEACPFCDDDTRDKFNN